MYPSLQLNSLSPLSLSFSLSIFFLSFSFSLSLILSSHFLAFSISLYIYLFLAPNCPRATSVRQDTVLCPTLSEPRLSDISFILTLKVLLTSQPSIAELDGCRSHVTTFLYKVHFSFHKSRHFANDFLFSQPLFFQKHEPRRFVKTISLSNKTSGMST